MIADGHSGRPVDMVFRLPQYARVELGGTSAKEMIPPWITGMYSPAKARTALCPS